MRTMRVLLERRTGLNETVLVLALASLMVLLNFA